MKVVEVGSKVKVKNLRMTGIVECVKAEPRHMAWRSAAVCYIISFHIALQSFLLSFIYPLPRGDSDFLLQ